MGAMVKNLYRVGERWKFRKLIPARLRPYIDGNITEFVRWLGKGGTQPSPDVLRRAAECQAECATLMQMAEKRAARRFDELNAESIAYIIAAARSDLLEQDDEERFDPAGDEVFASVAVQLEREGVAFHANPDADRLWNARQEALEVSLAAWRYDYARGRVSDFVADEVADLCAGRGLHVDPESLGFRKLGKAYLGLLIEVAEASLKRQRGEVVPTPEPPAEKAATELRSNAAQSITGLVDDWWKEAKAAGRAISTHDAYRRAAAQLAAFLKHDDARRVTQDDVIAFKDHRLANGASPKTVKDGDLSALRALFGWGVDNRRLAENPAKGVSVIVQRRAVGRPKGYTDEEAATVLQHAYDYRGRPGENVKLTAAKRWMPWLCAYTGARAGEIAQLRRKDVFEKARRWVVAISPEAVTVKGGEYREVPLHPHLVELGFPDFAQSAPEGFLFLRPSGEGEGHARSAWRTVKNKVTEFVREVISDPRVQPNHAWRHRLETLARDLEFREDVTNFITGHTMPGQVRADYGDKTIKAMAAALDRLPRYPVAAFPLHTEGEDAATV